MQYSREQQEHASLHPTRGLWPAHCWSYVQTSPRASKSTPRAAGRCRVSFHVHRWRASVPPRGLLGLSSRGGGLCSKCSNFVGIGRWPSPNLRVDSKYRAYPQQFARIGQCPSRISHATLLLLSRIGQGLNRLQQCPDYECTEYGALLAPYSSEFGSRHSTYCTAKCSDSQQIYRSVQPTDGGPVSCPPPPPVLTNMWVHFLCGEPPSTQLHRRPPCSDGVAEGQGFARAALLLLSSK